MTALLYRTASILTLAISCQVPHEKESGPEWTGPIRADRKWAGKSKWTLRKQRPSPCYSSHCWCWRQRRRRWPLHGCSGGTRTVIHFCISKTEHCIRTPHVSVIFDGVIVARKYPFVKTARLINYAARRKELSSYCTIPIPKARHMAQSPSREAARNTACKCLQHLIQCG